MAPDWRTTRKRYVRLCVPVLAVMVAAQTMLSWGHSPLRLMAGLAYVLACFASVWILLERAQLVRNTAPLLWKILTWIVPAASGFAMVGHLLFGRPLEQVALGGGSALVAVMSLFVAFSPDDADMIDNEQMTRPADPRL